MTFLETVLELFQNSFFYTNYIPIPPSVRQAKMALGRYLATILNALVELGLIPITIGARPTLIINQAAPSFVGRLRNKKSIVCQYLESYPLFFPSPFVGR